ncbi:MAG: phosphatase PAP2 family protein [Gammaproteobacteria bacterium]
MRFAAIVFAAALLQGAAFAQAPGDPGPSPAPEPAQVARLRDDIKAFATEPARWRGGDWLKVAGIAAAVGVAYHYDDKVHEHFANDGEPNYHEVVDAMPAAFVFGGMWFAAKLGHNEEAQWESLAMRRAFVLETLGSEVMKVAFRRKRPGPGVPANHWGGGGLSFPSGHTAAAFAIGTVLAESGDDKHRWWRRVLGYGVGVTTGYLRLDHDAHWLSDTVAGAALGIGAAKFVMKRRAGTTPRGEFAVLPANGGTMLTYTVPLR